MSNDFYNRSAAFAPRTKARSENVRDELDSVSAGFDKLPAPEAIQTGSVTYAADTGAADAYAIDLAKAPTAYTEGMTVLFKAANANTGASMLNVNGLGVKPLVRQDGTALRAGDISATEVVQASYSGAHFRLVSSTSRMVSDAETAAATATTQAGIATTQAGTATTQAVIATTKASEASGSAATASEQADIATTQAGTATTQAGVATTRAGEASNSADTATTRAEIATAKASEASNSASTANTQAGIATTKAGEARNDAAIASAMVGYSAQWAIKSEDLPVSEEAGGDGATTYSAFHWAQKAAASAAAAAMFDPSSYYTKPEVGALATELEMQEGTSTDVKRVTPALVRTAVEARTVSLYQVGEVVKFSSLADVPSNFLPMDGSIYLNSAYPLLAQESIPVFWDNYAEVDSGYAQLLFYIFYINDGKFIASTGSSSYSCVVFNADGTPEFTATGTKSPKYLEYNRNTGRVVFNREGQTGLFVADTPLTQDFLTTSTNITTIDGYDIGAIIQIAVNPESGIWGVVARNNSASNRCDFFYSKDDGDTWEFGFAGNSTSDVYVNFGGGAWYIAKGTTFGGFFSDSLFSETGLSTLSESVWGPHRIGPVNPLPSTSNAVDPDSSKGRNHSALNKFLIGSTLDSAVPKNLSYFIDFNITGSGNISYGQLIPPFVTTNIRAFDLVSHKSGVDVGLMHSSESPYNFHVTVGNKSLLTTDGNGYSGTSMRIHHDLSSAIGVSSTKGFVKLFRVDPTNPRFYLPDMNTSTEAVYAVYTGE